jgi:hypothetical protein
VIEPKGTREELAVLARQKYKSYQTYASSLSSSLSTAASTAVYGDPTAQASKSAATAYSAAADAVSNAGFAASASVKSGASAASASASSGASAASSAATSAYTAASSSVSSVIAQATQEVAREADDARDYVYSTWDDSRLRQFLQDRGLVEPHAETTRAHLLRKMREAYRGATDPLYSAWNDAYLRHWLVSHEVIGSSTPEKDTAAFREALAENLTREALSAKMAHYYYNTKDKIYSSWSDSDLHQWLVSHGVIKSDAQIKRDKLEKLVESNYSGAQDTIWSAWSESQMRDWLIDHGYLRTDAQKTRDELVKIMNAKYENAASKTAAYLVWPDARLRAYLRNRGVPESALPTTRPGLLQETRIRWVQTQTKAESIIEDIQSSVLSAVRAVEDTIGDILSKITGKARDTQDYTNEKVREASYGAEQAGYEGRAQWEDAKGTVRSKVASASGEARGEGEWARGKASSLSAEAGKGTARAKSEL